MRLVFGCDTLVEKYVSENIGMTISPPFTAIGATRDGKTLCGGVVFNHWNGSNIEFHLYGPGCMTRENLRGIFHYAFVQISANRVTASVKRSNESVRKLLPRLGFEFEGTSKKFYGPTKQDDEIRFVLFPERALRWMT